MQDSSTFYSFTEDCLISKYSIIVEIQTHALNDAHYQSLITDSSCFSETVKHAERLFCSDYSTMSL